MTFPETVKHLEAGDFSFLEPQFRGDGEAPAQIIRWHRLGYFETEPDALAEALSCASFLGAIEVVEFLLDAGVQPSGGSLTGLNAFHWAANRGQAEVVRLLLRRGASLETRNMYGTTVLGTAVWSAIHEPRPNHLTIIRDLLRAGASKAEVSCPTGRSDVDELLMRNGESPLHD